MAEQRIRFDDLVDLQDILAKTKQMIKIIETEVGELNSKLRSAQKAVSGASPTTKGGQATLKKQAQEISRVTAEKRELDRINKQLAKTEAQLAQVESKSNYELVKKREALKRTNAALREKANAELDAAKATKANTSFTQKMTNSIKAAGKQLLGMAAAAAGVTAVISKLNQAVKQSVKDFAEFETGQKNVQSLLDSFDKTLEKRTINLMKTYGLTIADTNKALFDAVSAGIPAAEATEFLGEAARLAIAGVTDLTTATDGITTVLNAYGLETKEAANVADAFFSAQKFGKTTVEELSNSIGNVAPIAKAANVSYQELLSTFALLTKNGISTEETSTAIRATITALIKPSEEAAKAMESYGIETGVAAIKNNGLFETLRQVAQVTQVNEDALTEFIPNVRALVGVASLSTEALTEYDTILKTVTEDTGDTSSATKAFEDQMSSLNKQMDVANAALKEQSIRVGQELKPAVIGLKGAWEGVLRAVEFAIKGQGNLGAGYLKVQREINAVTQETVDTTNDWADTVDRVIREANDREIIENAKAADKARKEREARELKALEAQAERVRIATAYRERKSQEARKMIAEQGQEAYKGVVISGIQELNNTELMLTQQNEENKLDILRASAEAQRQIEEDIKADRIKSAAETAQNTLEYLEQGVTAFANIFEAQKQRELSAAGDNAEKREEIEKKFFKKQQALNIALAIVEGAKGITKAVAESPLTFGLPFSAFMAATTAAQIATIASQKFAKGGYEILGGNLHSSGGTMTPIGEAEKGEGMAIFSRRATQRYGDAIPEIVQAINNGRFHDVWDRSYTNLINVSVPKDEYTRKMYELMNKTPNVYTDQKGRLVREYPNGSKDIIRG